MSQKENLEQLMKLHGIITGKALTLEQIVNRRTVDPALCLINNSEQGGRVTSGQKVSLKDYYTLGDQLDFRPSTKT